MHGHVTSALQEVIAVGTGSDATSLEVMATSQKVMDTSQEMIVLDRK